MCCSTIRSVGVSAISSEGIVDLFAKVDEARVEFEEVFLPDLLQYVYRLLFYRRILQVTVDHGRRMELRKQDKTALDGKRICSAYSKTCALPGVIGL